MGVRPRLAILRGRSLTCIQSAKRRGLERQAVGTGAGSAGVPGWSCGRSGAGRDRRKACRMQICYPRRSLAQTILQVTSGVCPARKL